jgi:hypothetical protein
MSTQAAKLHPSSAPTSLKVYRLFGLSLELSKSAHLQPGVSKYRLGHARFLAGSQHRQALVLGVMGRKCRRSNRHFQLRHLSPNPAPAISLYSTHLPANHVRHFICLCHRWERKAGKANSKISGYQAWAAPLVVAAHTWHLKDLVNFVKVIPGESSNVPITLLGSSDFSAQLAAALCMALVS